MKPVSLLLLLFLLLLSCNTVEEGLLGEWEGTFEKIGSDGKIFDAKASCEIRSASGMNRNVTLEVAGPTYDFTAVEMDNTLEFINRALNSDSTIIFYISGTAELLNDTLLHFEYETYSMNGNLLLSKDKMQLDMVRK